LQDLARATPAPSVTEGDEPSAESNLAPAAQCSHGIDERPKDKPLDDDLERSRWRLFGRSLDDLDRQPLRARLPLEMLEHSGRKVERRNAVAEARERQAQEARACADVEDTCRRRRE